MHTGQSLTFHVKILDFNFRSPRLNDTPGDLSFRLIIVITTCRLNGKGLTGGKRRLMQQPRQSRRAAWRREHSRDRETRPIWGQVKT